MLFRSKHSEVMSQLQALELEHQRVTIDIHRATKKQNESEQDEDALDAFMTNLLKPAPDKTLLNKIKVCSISCFKFSKLKN